MARPAHQLAEAAEFFRPICCPWSNSLWRAASLSAAQSEARRRRKFAPSCELQHDKAQERKFGAPEISKSIKSLGRKRAAGREPAG